MRYVDKSNWPAPQAAQVLTPRVSSSILVVALSMVITPPLLLLHAGFLEKTRQQEDHQ